jgi:hypothetical protein
MQCANPLCRAESIYFRSGSLHAIDRFEHYDLGVKGREQSVIWLCAKCSPCFVVETWRPPGQQMQPRVVNSHDGEYDLAA